MTTPHPLHGCFVTGTGPGVGNSHVRAALLHGCVQHGRRSGGLKPVAAGTVLIDGQPVDRQLFERLGLQVQGARPMARPGQD